MTRKSGKKALREEQVEKLAVVLSQSATNIGLVINHIDWLDLGERQRQC